MSEHRLCAITRCRNTPAVYWNSSTLDWYCPQCAKRINRFNPGLCSLKMELMPAKVLFNVMRKAIDLGMLPESSLIQEYTRNAERLQELIQYADLARTEFE